MIQHNTGNLDSLYTEILLDHYKSPRNKTDLSHVSEDDVHENPSCGDTLKLEIIMGVNGRIKTARFDGYGCAVSIASASLMTERLPGKTPREARMLLNTFLDVLEGNEPPSRLEQWGDLTILGKIIQFPLRVKCATLAWHALDNIIAK